jgi:hypothetical protein
VEVEKGFLVGGGLLLWLGAAPAGPFFFNVDGMGVLLATIQPRLLVITSILGETTSEALSCHNRLEWFLQ